MSGIFPTSGVPANQAANSVNTATTNCTELFHSTSRCNPRFDPASANAVISELLNTVAGLGMTYDCNRLDNLLTSIKHICHVATAQDPEADDKILFCKDGVLSSATFGDFFALACYGLSSLPNDSCEVVKVAFATDTDGCGRLYRYTDANLQVGRWSIETSHPAPFSQFFPLLPAISQHDVSHYTRQQLLADALVDPVVGGSAINAARLRNTLVLETDVVNFTCAGLYTFSYLSRGGINYSPSDAGISQIVITKDDGVSEKVIVSASGSSYWALGQFTSFESDINASDDEVMSVGNFKFRVYVVAADPSANAAQMRVAANMVGSVLSTSGNLTISKTV